MDPTHITVTAPAGVRTPIHPNDGIRPGGDPLFVVAGAVERVRYSQTIRRALGRGDLIACNMDGAPVTVALAAAPSELTRKPRIETLIPANADLDIGEES